MACRCGFIYHLFKDEDEIGSHSVYEPRARRVKQRMLFSERLPTGLDAENHVLRMWKRPDTVAVRRESNARVRDNRETPEVSSNRGKRACEWDFLAARQSFMVQVTSQIQY